MNNSKCPKGRMKSKTRKAAGKASLAPLVLPCPFCGASGESVEHKPYDAGVVCHGCGVCMPYRVSSEPGRFHGALELWNRRPNTELTGDLLAAAQLLDDCLIRIYPEEFAPEHREAAAQRFADGGGTIGRIATMADKLRQAANAEVRL